MKFIQFRIGDIVQMKKKHPCGSQEWEVLQLGSDMRIKCCGCGHIVLIPRPKFLKGAKKVLNRDITQDTPLAARTSEFEGEKAGERPPRGRAFLQAIGRTTWERILRPVISLQNFFKKVLDRYARPCYNL